MTTIKLIAIDNDKFELQLNGVTHTLGNCDVSVLHDQANQFFCIDCGRLTTERTLGYYVACFREWLTDIRGHDD